ncbi:BtrH N-terminal domain-containing protein [Paenibacillus sp. HW567]|uniref:BtrH N-terminal domain-containing protein n=1 Tax=Paenibacillus sp. HW567 TaxID=1034769 RepID=UPI000376D812|nr:BtrH N-terminal domain-containing protein [Paenibacillus sp. HW567]
MKSIILPMYEPKLNTYNVYAALFSIIAKDESYLPWFYSNFISIGINTCDDTLYFTDHFTFFEYGEGLTACPWLEVYKPPHKTIYYQYSFNIKEVLISYLDQNKYIWLYLDQFYIPQSTYYQQMHKEHSVLVYGYDDAAQVFYIADNLDNGKFIKTMISYQQLITAWESDICEHFRRLFRVLHRKQGEYTLNTAHLRNQIEDYLSSKTIHQGIYWDQVPVDGPHAYVQNIKYWIFGHEVYSYTLQLIQQAKRIKGPKVLDTRIPHLLWEHKKCMAERIHYLNLGTYGLAGEYEKVVNHSLTIRNLTIKYNLTKNDRILSELDTRISEVVHTEKNVLRQLVEWL